MNSLTAAADGVVERSNAVNGKLQHRQENIEELNQVRLLLHKLQVRCRDRCTRALH